MAAGKRAKGGYDGSGIMGGRPTAKKAASAAKPAKKARPTYRRLGG